MVSMSTTYVDRDEASEILKVSTRTLDRYVRKFRFKTRKDGRRVLIKRVDVDRIIQDYIGHYTDTGSTTMDKKLDNKKIVQDVSKIEVKDLKVEAVKRTEKEERVFQNLYIETKRELKEKQDRLDAATYRVGQLESEVKSMVPLLDFSRKEKELREARNAIEQKELERLQEVEKMETRFRNERIAKWIYLSLVGMLLVAEPILFLLWAFS